MPYKISSKDMGTKLNIQTQGRDPRLVVNTRTSELKLLAEQSCLISIDLIYLFYTCTLALFVPSTVYNFFHMYYKICLVINICIVLNNQENALWPKSFLFDPVYYEPALARGRRTDLARYSPNIASFHSLFPADTPHMDWIEDIVLSYMTLEVSSYSNVLATLLKVAKSTVQCFTPHDHTTITNMILKHVVERPDWSSWDNLPNSFREAAAFPAMDAFKNSFGAYKNIKNLPFFIQLRDMTIYFILQPLLLINGLDSEKYFRWFSDISNTKFRDMTTLSCLEMAIEIFITFFDNIGEFLTTFNPLVFQNTTYSDYTKDVQWLDDNFHNRVHMMPQPHQINQHDYMIRLHKNIEVGQSLIQSYSLTRSPLLNSVKSDLARAYAIRSQIQSLANNSGQRITPMGVAIVGNPKVGKSKVVNTILTLFGHRFKLPLQDECIYTRNTSDEFWTGYTDAVWVTILQEIAARNPDRSGDDPSIDCVMRMMESNPFPLNMAHLEAKGKQYFHSKLVIGTSNVPHYNARQHFSCPAAFQRRFPIQITLSVKPEFSYVRDGVSLDTIDDDKVALWRKENPGQIPEINVYEIRKITASSNKIAAEYDLVATCHTSEHFQREMLKLINMFYEVQVSYADIVASDVSAEFCNCGIMKHVCTHCTVAAARSSSNLGFLNTLLIGLLFVYGVFHAKCRASPSFRGAISTVYGMCLGGFSPFLALQQMVSSPWKYYFIFRATGHTANPIWHYLYMCRYVFLYNYSEDNLSFDIWLMSTIYLDNRSYYYTYRKQLQDSLKSIGFPKLNVKILVASSSIVAILAIIARIHRSSKSATVSGVSHTRPKEDGENKFKYMEVVHRKPPGRSPTLNASIDSIVNTCKRNLIEITAIATDGSSLSCYALCLRANLYISVAHIMPRDEHFRLDYISEDNRGQIRLQRGVTIIIDEINDISIFQILPLRPRADVYKFILDKHVSQKCMATWCTPSNTVTQPVTLCCIENQWDDNSLHKLFAYDMRVPCEKGQCGTPLLMTVGPYVSLGAILVASSMNKEVSNFTFISLERIQPLIAQLEKTVSIACSLPGELNLAHDIVPLHWKSRFNYRPDGLNHVTVFGSLKNLARARPKSKVRKSIAHDLLCGYYTPPLYGPPLLDRGYGTNGEWVDYMKYNLDLRTSPPPCISEALLAKACKSYSHEILKELGSRKMRILSLQESINGIAGESYIDSINFKTSPGYPLCGEKRDMFEFLDEEQPFLGVRLKSNFQREYDQFVFNYNNGEQNHPVFNSAPKDEVTKMKNIEKGKTRMFQCAPLYHSLYCRQLCLSFVQILQMDPVLFESAIGVDCASEDWEVYAHNMQIFENHVNGDFGAYDVRMPLEVLFYACQVIIKVAEYSGYSHADLLAMNNMFADAIYCYNNVDGDLVAFHQGHSSGWALTVIINSIANSLLMRVVYSMCGYAQSSFRDNVILTTYGDDNMMSVSPRVFDKFNQLTITEIFGLLNITYTMADKDATPRKNINFEECEFLKRHFVYDDKIQCWLAPIQEESILKSLFYRKDEGNISDIEHLSQVCMNAQREYFQHGKEKYLQWQKIMVILDEHFRIFDKNCNLIAYEDMLLRLYPGRQ